MPEASKSTDINVDVDGVQMTERGDYRPAGSKKAAVATLIPRIQVKMRQKRGRNRVWSVQGSTFID
jgi:hypothetical protein